MGMLEVVINALISTTSQLQRKSVLGQKAKSGSLHTVTSDGERLVYAF